jgi:hypothetical protein
MKDEERFVLRPTSADKERFAPSGKIWVCHACGKVAKDRYGMDGSMRSSGWDESCAINCTCVDMNYLVWQGDRVCGVKVEP